MVMVTSITPQGFELHKWEERSGLYFT